MCFLYLSLVTLIINLQLSTVYLVEQRRPYRPFEDMNEDSDIPLFNQDMLNWPKQLDFFSNYRPCAEELRNHCHNGATCMIKLPSVDDGVENDVESFMDIVCLCRLGWQGDRCDQPNPIQQQALLRIQLENGELIPCVNVMSSSQRPCHNRGTCLQRADMLQTEEPTVCLCSNGWHGEQCQFANNSETPFNSLVEQEELIDKDPQIKGNNENTDKFSEMLHLLSDCSPNENTCRNDAKCARFGDAIQCFCKPGWIGINCETKSDSNFTTCPPNQNPCHHGSTCQLENGQPVCHCAPNFAGERCDLSQIDDVDEENEVEFDDNDFTQALLFFPCRGQNAISFCASYGGICREFGLRGGSTPTLACFCYRGFFGERCEQFSFYKYADLPELSSRQS